MSVTEKTATVDFLIIGAQKAATTWLTEVLRQHPDIWMPPVKELHYFDADKKYPSQSYLSLHPLQRMFNKNNTARSFWRHAHQFIFQSIKQFIKKPGLHSLNEITWCFRYFFCNANDDWYVRLFKPGEGKVKGEASPSYSMLELSDVKKIQSMFPDLKIIFIMRNPIFRAWSHVRYNPKNHGTENIKDLKKIKAFIDGTGQHLRSDYRRTLSIWESCFPPEQFFFGFFDDINSDPKVFMDHVFNFLALDSTKLPESVDLTKKILVTQKSDLPKELECFLATKYLSNLEYLASRFDGPPAIWLAKALETLKEYPAMRANSRTPENS